MNKLQSLLALPMMLSAMNPEQQEFMHDHEYTEDALLKTLGQQKRPPSGTKEYFFNNEGDFSTEKMLKTECVFVCHAVNDRNALRKWYNWNNGKQR